MAITSMPVADFGVMFNSAQTAIAEIGKINNGLARSLLGHHAIGATHSGKINVTYTILGGSMWEYNGLMYMTDVDIQQSYNANNFYIYFNGSNFYASIDLPSWFAVNRNGWYNASGHRALFRVFFPTPNGVYDYEYLAESFLIPLKSQYYFMPYQYNDPYLDKYPSKGSDKTLVDYIVGNEKTVSLDEPGWYKVEMVSGGWGGGSGGKGSDNAASNSLASIRPDGKNAVDHFGAGIGDYDRWINILARQGGNGGNGGCPPSLIVTDKQPIYGGLGGGLQQGGGAAGGGMSGRHCTFDFFLKRPTALNMCGSFAPEESFIMGPGVYFDTRYGSWNSPGAHGTVSGVDGAAGGSGGAGWDFSGISMPQYYVAYAGNAGEDFPSNNSAVQVKGKGGAGGAAGSGFGAGGGGGGGGGSSSGRTESQNTSTYPGKNGGTGGAGAAGVCLLYKLT